MYREIRRIHKNGLSISRTKSKNRISSWKKRSKSGDWRVTGERITCFWNSSCKKYIYL